MIVECVEKVEPGPPKLLSLAAAVVGGQVVRGLLRGRLEFHQTYIPEPLERSLREWVGDLPTALRQDLLQRAARTLLMTIGRVVEMTSSTVPILLAALLEVLYCPGLGSVEVWTDLHWHQEARMKILHLLHSVSSNVKKLNFACYKTPIFQFQALPFSERFLLMNVLNKFPALSSLCLPYVADDNLLCKLGSGVCPTLKHIDVQGSWEVTNQGVAGLAGQGQIQIGRAGWQPTHFAQCEEGQKLLGSILQGSQHPIQPGAIASMVKEQGRQGLANSLMALGLEGTAVDQRGLQTALQSFHALRRLGADEQHWQALLVGLGNGGQGCRDCYPATLPLTNVNLQRHTYELLQPLARLLPNLEHISMANFERSESYLDGEDHLPILASFQSLAHLTLNDVDLPPLLAHLRSSGAAKRIHSLCFKGRHKQLEAASVLASCPSLTELTVENVQVKFTPGLAGLQPGTTFPKMRKLSMRDVHFEGDQACWRRLIKSCPNLEILSLQNIRLNDADMTDILTQPGLPSLKEINISATGTINLTEESVFRLVSACPLLQRVGGVCGWACADLLAALDRLSCDHHFKIKHDDQTD